MFTDIYTEDYQNGKFLVKGNTRPYKESIKKLGGFWKPTEKAWCFNSEKKNEVEKWINSGNHIAQVSEATTSYDRVTNTQIMKKLESLEKMLNSVFSKLGGEDVIEDDVIEDDPENVIDDVIAPRKRLLRKN